ncbi:bifunctional DNA primase/polymerase [Streptomyces sp. NPDC048603]|uniref:bifunctional DNA primase/polymerase n=1 Tax=Streptomyces sp. NPDC048603 TaxID=3365577 RepID=UPI00372042FC
MRSSEFRESRTAVEWLVSASPDPETCRWEWERNPYGVTLLPAGRRWDVLILPGRLGRATFEVLTLLRARPGPVLSDSGDARLGFFVPAGTTSRWLGTGVRGAGRGTWIVVPYPGRGGGGARWLVVPDGQGTLTEPAVLELAMHEAAARVAGQPG